MSTELDLKILPAVLSALSKVGISATIRNSADASDYDPSTGSVTFTPTEYTNQIVAPPQRYNRRYVDGDTILAEDTYTFIAGSGLAFVPSPGWEVDLSSETWKVVSVQFLRSGDDVAAYKLQLRRS